MGQAGEKLMAKKPISLKDLRIVDYKPGATDQENRNAKKRKGDLDRGLNDDVQEKNKGLWANIHAKRKRGEKPNPPGHPDRPTDADFKRSQKESVELDELSKKTLGSYVKKASRDVAKRGAENARDYAKSNVKPGMNKKAIKNWKREIGIDKAIDKMTKESVQIELEEKAPKMGDDFVAVQRKKDADHAKAMGRSVKTGRKLPTKKLTPAELDRRRMSGVSEDIDEKTLTPAEKKKREEIAKAMERENPGMPMAKKMAIATATAKKVAESINNDGWCAICGNEPCTCVDTQSEALDIRQRRKRSISARKNKSKLAMGRKRASRRVADMDKLRKRSRRAARNVLVQKLLKNVPKDELSPARKQEIEKRVDKLGPRIDRIAKKLLPRIRQAEIQRKKG